MRADVVEGRLNMQVLALLAREDICLKKGAGIPGKVFVYQSRAHRGRRAEW